MINNIKEVHCDCCKHCFDKTELSSAYKYTIINGKEIREEYITCPYCESYTDLRFIVSRKEI